MESPDRKKYTFQGYLEYEVIAKEKHEFLRSEIFNMAGGSLAHSTIGTNVTTALRNGLPSDSGCRVFNSDAMVLIESADAALYPDATVVCGPVMTSPLNQQAIVNPALLIEVLSDSTEARDRGTKFAAYREIPSFREYLLIAQERPWVDRFWKNDEGVWQMESFSGLDSRIALHTAEMQLSLQSLYAYIDEFATP